jgi:hypothetical protein
MKLTAAFLVVLVSSIAFVVPFVQADNISDVNAGLDQTVYSGQVVTFSGSVNLAYISEYETYEWDFGDGSPPVTSSSIDLLTTTTHIYTALSTPLIFTATLGVEVDGEYTEWEYDTVDITVLPNPPSADAGADQTVELTSPSGAATTLDASASSDPEGQPLTYSWVWSGGSASGVTPTATFPLGTTTVTLTAMDPYGLTDTDTVDITVVDTTAPVITVSVTPDLLWPPNHKYVEVTATVTVTDLSDPALQFTLVSVTSNEPDNGAHDGNTVNDIVILDAVTFQLRAERSGIGSGRVYTITYHATDASGNTASTSATVTVPMEI